MPEPVLVAIAAALAGKAAHSLYDLVKRKFSGRKEAVAALEAARGAEPDSAEVQVLAAELERVEAEDPQFATELREVWREASVQQADHGSVINQISGNADKVVQARDIKGDINF